MRLHVLFSVFTILALPACLRAETRKKKICGTWIKLPAFFSFSTVCFSPWLGLKRWRFSQKKKKKSNLFHSWVQTHFFNPASIFFAFCPTTKGVALSTGHDTIGYRQWYTDYTLRQIRAQGSNYIQVSSYLGQRGENSLKTFKVTDDKSIIYIIRKVKRAGFKVFYKPVIEPETRKGGHIWRGRIPGTNAWFKKVYIPWIVRMARIAQREKVDIFAMGSEYARAIHRTSQWIKVIQRVRAVYKGKLTYIANHDVSWKQFRTQFLLLLREVNEQRKFSNKSEPLVRCSVIYAIQSYTRAKFFHKLDLISLSAYFKLLPGRRGHSPSLLRSRQLYRRRVDKITRWLQWQDLTDKKVLVAEYGIQSKGKTQAIVNNSHKPFCFTFSLRYFDVGGFFTTLIILTHCMRVFFFELYNCRAMQWLISFFSNVWVAGNGVAYRLPWDWDAKAPTNLWEQVRIVQICDLFVFVICVLNHFYLALGCGA